MPEGPEIRLAADKIAKVLVGHSAESVEFAFPQLQHYQPDLECSLITAVETYGKAMLTRFDSGLNIYSHNQLYGIWVVVKRDQLPDTKRSLRLAIHTANHSALLYSASDIEVLRDEEIADHRFISRIGPDALHMSVTHADVLQQLMSKRFHRRRLYALLLDQAFVAGLGNYLRSEILFVAKLHPTLRPCDCSAEQLHALAEACLSVTRQSYRTKGITTDEVLANRLRADGYRRRDYRWWVFGRDGQPCFHCGTPIEKVTLGGRRLYFCPVDQPAIIST